MTVELSVSDVREELRRAWSGEGEGEPSVPLLGRMFHEVFADLVDRDPRRNAFRVLAQTGPDRALWSERLLAHAYQVAVGPRLLRNQAQLQSYTPNVLSFWSAVEAMVQWLTELAWTAAAQDAALASSWKELASLVRPEVQGECELCEPGWTDSVRLTGVADAVVRVPEREGWCILELKLGRGSPEADLGQAVLYHLLAARGGAAAEPSAIAVTRFTPAIEERVFAAREIEPARDKLLALVGRMAGVLPGGSPARAGPDSRAVPLGSAPTATRAHVELGARMVRAFRDFGAVVELRGAPIVGPRFLRFELKLGKGVRASRVKSLAGEVQVALGLPKAPLVMEDQGKLTADIPRPDPEVVPFESVRGQLPGLDPLHGSAKVPVGVDVYRTLHFADLAAPVSAHLLVAGTTGSGKTEWLRLAVAGLLCTNTPKTLSLVLLDPKLAAFGDLRGSPFLRTIHGLWEPGSGVEASEVLEDLVEEMERRYQRFAAAGVDSIAAYVEKTRRPLPRIVCFCDEYYALISRDRGERGRIEASISLLGAKGRAAGVHLILATQQPSRRVIEGPLDANIPCRVGLMTAKALESRMLLGSPGAEQLSGYGDLLCKDLGAPKRLQAPLLTPATRKDVFARPQTGTSAAYDPPAT